MLPDGQGRYPGGDGHEPECEGQESLDREGNRLVRCGAAKQRQRKGMIRCEVGRQGANRRTLWKISQACRREGRQVSWSHLAAPPGSVCCPVISPVQLQFPQLSCQQECSEYAFEWAGCSHPVTRFVVMPLLSTLRERTALTRLWHLLSALRSTHLIHLGPCLQERRKAASCSWDPRGMVERE